ncbi:MAG: MCE family protein [Aquificae bacterium]|nr:MCE family protein [Aquificota bacterium]
MQTNAAFKVGLFVTLAALALAGTILFFGEVPLFREKLVEYYAYFKNVAGLSKGSDVRVSGVKVGKVKELLFEGGKVKVVLEVKEGVPLYRDAVARIESLGLLGDKYVEVDPGSPEAGILPPGSTIPRTEEPADFTKVVETFQRTGESIDLLARKLASLVEENRKELERLLVNLNELAVSLRTLTEENRENLKRTLENVAVLTEELKTSVPKLVRSYERLTETVTRLVDQSGPELRRTVRNLADLSEALSRDLPALVKNLEEITETVARNRDEIERTLENLAFVTEQIRRGRGTLGKLVTDEGLYRELKKSAGALGQAAEVVSRTDLHLEAWAQYQTVGESKAGLNLMLQPSPTHYYLLGVVGDSAGRVTKKVYYEDGNPRTVYEKDYQPEFNLQYARIFRDPIFGRGAWVLRFGLKESTGGVGLDYVVSDRFMFFFDVWDFGREDRPYEDLNPNTELGVKFFVYGPFFARLGGYDLLNEEYRSVFLGGGMSFTDNDLKYLLGTVGMPGF